MRWDTSADRARRGVVVDLARKAVALRPDDARQWELLAHTLLLMERDDEAVAVLTDAVARLPAIPKLPLMLADIHHRRGRGDLFERVMRQVPEIPADDLPTTLHRLELLMKAAAANDAGRIAREVLALDPTHDAAMECLAYALKGSPEAMVPICRAALDRKAAHVQARYELAAAYARLGRSDEARRVDRSRSLRPRSLRHGDRRGVVGRIRGPWGIRGRPERGDRPQSDAETRSGRQGDEGRPADRGRSCCRARWVGRRLDGSVAWSGGYLRRRPARPIGRSFHRGTSRDGRDPCLGSGLPGGGFPEVPHSLFGLAEWRLLRHGADALPRRRQPRRLPGARQPRPAGGERAALGHQGHPTGAGPAGPVPVLRSARDIADEIARASDLRRLRRRSLSRPRPLRAGRRADRVRAPAD